MNRLPFYRGVCFVVLLFACAMANAQDEQPKGKTIPLDQIWANRMPGTIEIEDAAKLADLRRLGSIFESWSLRAERMKFKDIARTGFTVSGSGESALQAALAAFVEAGKPRRKFSPDDEVTIVFFSEPYGGNHVRLEQVERKGDHIEIQYRLEPYFERTLSETFALIPLGKLPVGVYHVEMRQLPREQKFIELGFEPLNKEWSGKVLCKSFSFTVSEKGE